MRVTKVNDGLENGSLAAKTKWVAVDARGGSVRVALPRINKPTWWERVVERLSSPRDDLAYLDPPVKEVTIKDVCGQPRGHRVTIEGRGLTLSLGPYETVTCEIGTDKNGDPIWKVSDR